MVVRRVRSSQPRIESGQAASRRDWSQTFIRLPASGPSELQRGVNSFRQHVSSGLLRAGPNSIGDMRDLPWTVPRKHALLWA
jgi:hypothetical protein